MLARFLFVPLALVLTGCAAFLPADDRLSETRFDGWYPELQCSNGKFSSRCGLLDDEKRRLASRK